MSWRRHNYAYIVMGVYGPYCDNGQGWFTEGSYAEVFLDLKVARWVRDDHRKSYLHLAEHAPIVPPITAKNTTTREEWLRCARKVRVVKIALPGTYAQFQIPGRLERMLNRSQKEMTERTRKRMQNIPT